MRPTTLVDLPATSISSGDGWLGGFGEWPGDQGDVASPSPRGRCLLGFDEQVPRWVGGREFGVDALALPLSAIGARDATASSLPLRRVCAAHRGHRATVGPVRARPGKPLARDPPLTRQNPPPCTPRP
jgi:hypothetical protein